MGIRRVGARVFAGVGRALGLEGAWDAYGKVDTETAHGVLPLDSWLSYNLTVEEEMVGVATSVGAASWEWFPFFTVDDCAFPENAWLMDATSRLSAGGPTGGMLIAGDAAAGSQRMLRFWVSYASTQFQMGLQSTQNQLWTPYPLPSREGGSAGTPSTPVMVGTIQMGIDPGAIGDAIEFRVRVRSAPGGVRVWGTW